MNGLVCDFCSTPVPLEGCWTCPAGDFDTGVPFGVLEDGTPVNDYSVGGWCACRRCVSLVRAGRREHLARRSVDTFLSANPKAKGQRDVLLRAMRELHDEFWARRDGEPRLIAADEYAIAEAAPSGRVITFVDGPLRTANWIKETR